MALPQDGQDANGLTKVTQIPAGKELMFIDPTTNEGGIITLEDLTKQILNGLTSQTFGLDSGTQTLPAAINYLYGKTGKMYVNYSETDLDELYNTIQTISACVCPSNTPNIPEQSTGFAITIKYDSNAQMQIYIAINKNIYIRNSNSEWTKL